MSNPTLQTRDPTENHRSWCSRLGAAGFLFFLIKGLLWLVAPALLALVRDSF